MAEIDIDDVIATPDGDTTWGDDMRGAMTTLKTRYGPGLTDVAVADGGTGASDAAGARANLGAASATVAINAQTAAYTLVLADAGKAVEVNAAGAVTVTVPTNATAAFPIGSVVEVAQIGAGQVTLAGATGVTLQSRGGALKTAGQFAVASLRKRATDTWIVAGDVVV